MIKNIVVQHIMHYITFSSWNKSTPRKALAQWLRDNLLFSAMGKFDQKLFRESPLDATKIQYFVF